MKLCSDFFGDFHVIGTELTGNTMSSFKNKKSLHRVLFVHSKLGMKYEKKKNELLISFNFLYIISMKSEPNYCDRKHQHSHGNIWGK